MKASLVGQLRGAGASIQLKLSAVIVALVLTVAALLTVAFTARYVRDLEGALVQKAETYGKLVAREVSSAVAFNDQQTAREVFEAIAVDDGVAGVALYGASGRLLEARGELEDATPPGTSPPALSIARTARVIRVLAPVVSIEGPRGALVLEMSTQAVTAGRRRAVTQAVGWGAGAAVLGLLAAWFIARSFARRLAALSRAATAVAGGNLDQEPVVDRSRDEIGQLTEAFNAMWSKLKTLLDQIQRSAREEAERLEGLVRVRTTELDQRNAEMRMVLDNVEQGLVTVDVGGHLGVERSRILESWFGASKPGDMLWDWLVPADEERRRWFAMSWEALGQDVLPLELAIDQLPARLERGDTCFELTYKPLLADGTVTRMLVVVTDMTARRERERAERERKELGEVIERFYRDREGVVQYFQESRRLVATVDSSDEPVLLARALHTLKGNSGMMGLAGMVQVCHDLESKLVDGQPFASEERAQLGKAWEDVERRFAMVLEHERDGRFEISEQDYQALLQALDRGATATELRLQLQRLRHEPIERQFNRLAEQAARLAERLSKGPLEVAIQGNDVRLPPQSLSEFWAACVHVVRNAVDHGLEEATVRQQNGQIGPARLSFSAQADGEGFEVEIRDFGRGIDWAKLKARAQQKGLPCGTEQELLEVLFADGVSTKDEVTEVSGRGVGMSAARQACQQVGGTIRVASQPGAGTGILFRFPAARLGLIPPGRAEGDRPKGWSAA
jgi:two-component system chemotaxis sensor kinase CheA